MDYIHSIGGRNESDEAIEEIRTYIPHYMYVRIYRLWQRKVNVCRTKGVTVFIVWTIKRIIRT